MASVYRDIDEFFMRAEVTIDNARQTPEILAALSIYGYDDARLQEGRSLLDTALARHAAQIREYGEQHQATEALKQAWKAADDLYATHRRLTSLALKHDPKRLHLLGLGERKKRSLSGWIGQTMVYYTNALDDSEALNALARFNITRENLEQGQALVQQVIDLNKAQEQAKYEAQQATQDRDAAVDELDDWLSDFQAVARIALADTQQLEALQLDAIP